MAARRKSSESLRSRFAARPDPFGSALLVFPLFILYQLGILLGARGGNGVDFATRFLVELCDRDLGTYLMVLTGMLVGYAVLLAALKKGGTFRMRALGPVVLESAIYALLLGSLIIYIMENFLGFIPGLAADPLVIARPGLLEILVISAGAGFHEELVFRVVMLGGLAALLARWTSRWLAWGYALAASSLLFALVHHLGPAGEPFSMAAFVFRCLAGACFGLLYTFRGFPVAAWTHALYDVYVFSFSSFPVAE